ncbi:glycosyl hydrolases family 15-domain-containing protein [Dichotomocladium elegans]|nr:glycosyl hydrolases family 15-domain-containing protein [Dichotomocladium elegans]
MTLAINSSRKARDRLDYYYHAITTTIISKQNAVSGLIPASVAVTTHGDYTDAWVRYDFFELEHTVIKLMRGLLFAMMRQAEKVEKFKKTQALEHSLHAKYNTTSGETVVGDFEWGHLQIDATSLFLLAMADMTTSGLHIVFTQDEVDFVQNLVFYIERAYRTPDYGIWERGNKSNHGQPELNSSSIGMALAALRAINGVNLFGARGGPSSVIHVLPDELTRNATTLHSFLPRESNSKEIDGSVLSVIGFPAFAVTDPELIRRSKQEAKEKLEGKYGMKRFLRDGHQTVLEDTSRLHYNLSELKIFENIESEWPLFFTYLVLEGLLTGDREQALEYRRKLDPLIIDSATMQPAASMSGAVSPGGASLTNYSSTSFPDTGPSIPLVAELYYVPAENIEAEKANPHSQVRYPNDNIPLVWALSLYFLGCLIEENLLSPSEIDPLGRRFAASKISTQHIVQVVLLSEDASLQSTLAMYGLETQTMEEVGSGVTILHPKTLAEVYAGLGRNKKLGLSGRPMRPVGVMGTSRFYRIQGQLYAFTPHFMDNEEFYLNSDPDYLMSAFESEINFTAQNWIYPGRPTIVVVLTRSLVGSMHNQFNAFHQVPNQSKRNLFNFFMNLRCGQCGGVRVRLCRLAEAVNTSSIESLDFLINQPDMDWESILLGANRSAARRRRSIHRKLGYDETETQATTPGSSRTPGTKTPRRRNTGFHGKSLISPLDDPAQDGYFEQLASALARLESSGDTEPRFRLKSPENSPVVRKAVAHNESPSRLAEDSNASPAAAAAAAAAGSRGSTIQQPPLTDSPQAADMLSLVLGDPSQFQQAVENLVSSVNLYDQIDLLQYLASCKPLDFFVQEFDATIKELLEEVFVKSMQLQYWAIARQAAGLLHKIVPSLTINITDLVIRQKQVSIGSGPREYLMSMPTGPDALAKMIAEHCNDDVREGPVVQEIIIYLGSFIRTIPHIFDGILRLRTHYIIIALREEISRINGCNEEEAVEHLMQLSPYELKSLLGTILSGPSLSGTAGISQENLHNRPRVINSDENNTNRLTIKAQSAGFSSGNFARVEINGNVMEAPSRGIHVWAIDRGAKVILERASFDTHIATQESHEFKRFIDWLALGTIVVIASKDDFTEHLDEAGISAFESLGSKLIRKVGYRDSYVLIAEKGGPPEDTIEVHKKSDMGPTHVVEKHVELAPEMVDGIGAEGIHSGENHLTSNFPKSNGRWLRRRKNDGAFNRVPRNFFPNTWHILDCSKGLRINKHELPRDPTVLEKTPEEFNFALAVEGFLGYFKDPAERQIAVETLTVVHKLKERNPEMRVMDSMIDLSVIMNTAVEYFWNKWAKEGERYETHKELAHKLFYDLPQQGATESTFAYLSKAALKVLPFEFDYQ